MTVVAKPRRRKKGEVLTTGPRLSPAEAYVRSLPGENYLLTEVAEEVGMNPHTIRRLIKADPPRVKAPSYIGSLGKQEIYVFTAEDLAEVKAYYQRRYEMALKPGRKKEK